MRFQTFAGTTKPALLLLARQIILGRLWLWKDKRICSVYGPDAIRLPHSTDHTLVRYPCTALALLNELLPRILERMTTPRLRAQKWAVTKIIPNRLQIDIHSILATEQHELLLSNLHGCIHVMAVFRAAAGGGATVVVFGLGTLLVTNVIITVVKRVVTLKQVVSAVIDSCHLLQTPKWEHLQQCLTGTASLQQVPTLFICASLARQTR